MYRLPKAGQKCSYDAGIMTLRPGFDTRSETITFFNPLSADLNPIHHLLALLGAHPILHINP